MLWYFLGNSPRLLSQIPILLKALPASSLHHITATGSQRQSRSFFSGSFLISSSEGISKYMRRDKTNSPLSQRFPLTINYKPDLPKWFPLAWSSILSSLNLFFFFFFFTLLQRGLFPLFPTLIVFWHITLLNQPQRSPIIHFWYHCLVVELEEGCTLGSGSQDWQWDINSFILVGCDSLHHDVLDRGSL